MRKLIYKKKLIINDEWLYHGYNINNLESILENGILCCFLLKLKLKIHKNSYYNGPFYVSLSKRNFNKDSIYKTCSETMNIMLIIENQKVYKTKNNTLTDLLTPTILPFRYSVYTDEYQCFFKVSPSNIKAIKINDAKNNLQLLKQILVILNNKNIHLPIYDYQEDMSDTIFEIDQEKTLSLI